ncbi:MAG: SusC/RagA family TonB-linked outer membrane protein [Bacteroidetes bacterium]|nr:SusC/RagA family TonB-linked outer membrane protein [Bacteroidota bacterium]
MRKFTILLAFMMFLGLQATHAQKKVISGKVTSAEDGTALPGVTVIVKGTTLGTSTDVEGNYQMSIPEKSTFLSFSFIGKKTVESEIGSRTVINVTMEDDVMNLDEVVVTAIGITKTEKSLGYSATQIGAEEITKANVPSVLNSLQGKVAGVNISSASSNPGASTRVISRGFSSLAGSNQVLYVIDGVPIDNTSLGSSSLNGGTDFGNRGNDINPEDIESVTFLKGSAGTALYGSRAANGVIVITTKKGRLAPAGSGKKAAQITFATSAMFDSPLKLPTFQNEYGEGFFGETDLLENTSWGPKFDGKDRLWGHVVDNSQKLKPYVALPNNVRDFFDVGQTLTNSLSITNATENSSYYFSYSNVNADGIFPTNVDQYKRNTIALRGFSKLANNFTSSASINYVKKQSSFVPTGQDQSVYNNIMQTPRDISLLELRDYQDKFNNLDNYYSLYTANPWYTLSEHGNRLNEDRVFGSIGLDYALNDWITSTLRVGSDIANAQIDQWRAITSMEGNNASNSNSDVGRVSNQSFFSREFNTDLLVNFIRDINEDIEFKGLVGWNVNQRNSKSLFAQVIGLDIPYFYHISNSSATPVVDETTSKRRLMGLFASVDLGYKDYLYLTLTGRNDWSSTLPKENNTFFYPGANLSFIFTELVDLDFLPFGKLRAGWAQTGNDADPYDIYSVFVSAGQADGFRNLNYPLAGNINAFEVSNQIGNPNLQPEITTEFEIGTDLRFFNNRIGVDFTYYNKNITNLIWPVSLAYSTGFSTQVLNLGNITNKGVELLLTATPVKSKDFRWDITFNFTKNNNELVELAEGLDQVSLGGLSTITFVAKPGHPIGLIEGIVPLTDDDGNIVVDNNGIPVADEEKEIYGDAQYDYMFGVTNNLKYKNVTFSFLIDVRQGGLMYSRTADIQYFAGTAPQTLYNDRQPFIVPNSVVQTGTDANGDPVYEENTNAITNDVLYTYWGNGGTMLDRAFVIDKSFVKLREVVLSYNLPNKWFAKTPFSNAQLSIVGRNLLLWTPQDQTFIDPELTTFGNDLNADYGEFSAAPTTRSIGGSLKFSF